MLTNFSQFYFVLCKHHESMPDLFVVDIDSILISTLTELNYVRSNLSFSLFLFLSLSIYLIQQAIQYYRTVYTVIILNIGTYRS